MVHACCIYFFPSSFVICIMDTTKKCYCYNTLHRLWVMERVVRLTEGKIEKKKAALEVLLKKMDDEYTLKNECQTIESRLNPLRKQLDKEKFKLASREELKSTNDGTIKIRKDNVFQLSEDLNKFILECENEKKSLIEERDNFRKAENSLINRRNQLINDLQLIYPIQNQSGKFTICNIHLPNSEELKGHHKLDLAAALGYVCHLLILISYMMDIPLRYPLWFNGSRSLAIDYFRPIPIPEADQAFPLFYDKSPTFKFHYAVYLVNKNIAQLRYCNSLTTENLQMTLANIHSLVQERRKILDNGKNIESN